MVEKIVEATSRDGGARGLGLAGVLTGSLALLSNLANGNSVLNPVVAPRAAAYPTAYPAAPGGVTVIAEGGNGYVSDKEMHHIRECNEKDATIARLTAEKYSDAALKDYDKTEVEPLKTRVCELEKESAVTAAEFRAFRRYANDEFVHQPKAKMRQSIVVCQQCGCDEHDCCCG